MGAMQQPANPKTSNAGKILGGIAAVMAVVVAVALGSMAGSKGLRSIMQPSYDPVSSPVADGFKSAVADLKALLPRRIDHRTVITDAYAKGTTFTYVYEIDTKDYQYPGTLDEHLKKTTATKVCGTSNMRNALSDGGTFRYEYRDSNRQVAGAFEIKESDCQ
jgi:hypothetical protein